MTLAQTTIADLSYVEALFAIIICWLLVALATRFWDNLCYNTLGLNPESSYHAFIVFFITLAIFLVVINSVNSVAEGLITGVSEAPPATPGVPLGTSTTTNNPITKTNSVVENKILLKSHTNGSVPLSRKKGRPFCGKISGGSRLGFGMV